MSKSEGIVEQFESKVASHRAKIKAREERIRREEIELEKERAAFVAEGQAYFDGRLNALREQAVGFAVSARDALAKLPPAPVEPNVNMVTSAGFDAYMAAAEAYPAAAEAHHEAAVAACAPLAAALRGLVRAAGDVRSQCRSLGFRCFEGVGFLREDERKPRPGTALIAFANVSDNPVDGVARAAECGALTAEQAGALIDLLKEPAPAPPPQQTARIWQRITKASEEREREREFAERGGPPLTQTQRDVEKYINGLGTTGGRPLPHATSATETPK